MQKSFKKAFVGVYTIETASPTKPGCLQKSVSFKINLFGKNFTTEKRKMIFCHELCFFFKPIYLDPDVV